MMGYGARRGDQHGLADKYVTAGRPRRPRGASSVWTVPVEPKVETCLCRAPWSSISAKESEISSLSL